MACAGIGEWAFDRFGRSKASGFGNTHAHHAPWLREAEKADESFSGNAATHL
jgi:hypothetical protein